MAIARNPNSKQAEGPGTADAAAERFISGAAPSKVPLPSVDDAGGRKPAMIRFDRELLARVDRAAKRSGISRSAWISYQLSRVLDDAEG